VRTHNVRIVVLLIMALLGQPSSVSGQTRRWCWRLAGSVSNSAGHLLCWHNSASSCVVRDDYVGPGWQAWACVAASVYHPDDKLNAFQYTDILPRSPTPRFRFPDEPAIYGNHEPNNAVIAANDSFKFVWWGDDDGETWRMRVARCRLDDGDASWSVLTVTGTNCHVAQMGAVTAFDDRHVCVVYPDSLSDGHPDLDCGLYCSHSDRNGAVGSWQHITESRKCLT